MDEEVEVHGMRMWRGRGGVLMAVAALTLGITTPAQAQDELSGTWTARLNDDGEVRVRLVHDDDRHDWGQGMRDADAEALWAAAVAGPVDWSIEAPAGVVRLTGERRGNRAMGEFTFSPDPDFPARMRAAGMDGRIDIEEQLAAALYRVSEETVRSLVRLGIEAEDFGEVLASRIFEIDADFVEGLRDAGVDGDLSDFLAFSIHGVTPDYVREVRRWDVGRVDADELLAFRIHGVDREHAEGLREAGLGTLDADDLIAARIHRVTPEWAADVARWELGRADFDDLLAMRIHGVTAEWIEGMADLGLRPADAEEAISFRVHRVNPEWVRELREAGHDDLTADELVRIRIHGLERILRRRGGGR